MALASSGLWHFARGARQAHCRGVQQHIRAACGSSIPRTGVQGCAQGNGAGGGSEGPTTRRGAHHLPRLVHLQSPGTPGQ